MQGGTHVPTGVASKMPPRPKMFALSSLPTSHSVLDVTSDIFFVCMTFTVNSFLASRELVLTIRGGAGECSDGQATKEIRTDYL